MPRGIYKRKKKVGRPKGRKNTLIKPQQLFNYNASEAIESGQLQTKAKWITPTETPSFISRLEAATVKYEQAINEAIAVLKG